jgi:two-component system, OmpR family, sensor kinase
MDGLKSRIASSLQARLSGWLGLVILVTALIAAALSFYAAYAEAIDVQDDELRQLAVLVSRYDVPSAGYTFVGDPSVIDVESQIVVEPLPLGANAVVTQGPLSGLGNGLIDGLQTVRPGKLAWRIAVKTLPSGQQIAVGQRTAVRVELARDGALRTLFASLVLVPILLLVVATIVRKTFAPIKQLSIELDRQHEDDLRAIPDKGLPTEIRPFIVAINQLLARVARSVAVQHRFVADAAHELRSPLTAMSLQAERLSEAEMSPEAKDQLQTLRHGISRNRALVTQLLTFARAQGSTTDLRTNVSAFAVVRQVLEDLMPLAELRHIDLGVVGSDDATVLAAEADLMTLVRNIVDNAIRYTPTYGKVDLEVRKAVDHVELIVSDTGPGIAPDEREKVLEPFYRTLGTNTTGSGLGLSIVQAIATRIGATIQLEYADESAQIGLRVCVLLPLTEQLG